MPVQIEVESDAVVLHLRKISQKSYAEIVKGVREATQYTERHILKNLLRGQVLKVRSGTLRRSLVRTMVGSTGIIAVSREAWYGKLHEFGVRGPWTIRPKGRALRFKIGGRTVFASRVIHPGLKERSFMRRGLRESTPAIKRIIERRLEEALRA